MLYPKILQKKTKLRILNSKKKRLVLFSSREISVVGERTAKLNQKNKSKVMNLLVLEKPLQFIFGKDICEALGLIKRIEVIKEEIGC